MKYLICTISLLIVLFCAATHADENKILNILERSWDGTNLLGYELFLMGDKAIPILIENLTNDDHLIRENAMRSIQQYYPEPNVMSALTVVFIHSEDNVMRNMSAHTMADIDPEFAKKLMFKHLDTDPITQEFAVTTLLKLKDERVIPYLVEWIENPDIGPEWRRKAIFGLADFQDKRAVPELLAILKYSNINAIAIQKTAQIDDPRTVSKLLEAMDPDSDLGRRVSNSITTTVINSMSKFGLSSVQKMLDTAKTTEVAEVEQKILKILRKVENKEVIPIFEKECIETENEKLKSALVNALKNMGQEGFAALVNVAKQNPSTTVLDALTSFNSPEAIDAVSTIVLNPASQLRLQAVETLTKFGTLRNAEIYKYIPQLLNDPIPGVRISAINTIRKMKLTEMIPKLEQLARDSKGNTRNAALMTIDELSGKTPLDLKIEMVSKKYDYRHPIALKYTIKNISHYPIKIGFKKDVETGYLKLEIQQPDGTTAVETGYLKLEIQQPDGTTAKVYGQSNRFRAIDTSEYNLTIVKDGEDEIILLPVDPKHFDILQPNEVITNIIPVSKNYRLFQTGRYNVQLKMFCSPWKPVPVPKRTSLDKTPPLSSHVKSNLMAWEKPLISPKATFEIKAPTPMQFNTMLKMLDPNHINNYDIKQLEYVCFQLGELRKPESIKPLKLLSASLVNVRSSSRSSLGVSAHKALLKYTDTDMTQLWLQILGRQNIYNEIVSDVIYKLRTTGDDQYIETLKKIFLQSRNIGVSAELASILSQLGDDSFLQWIRSLANRKLHSWDKETRMSAAILLSQLNQPNAKEIRLPMNLKDELSFGEIHSKYNLSRPIWFSWDVDYVSFRNPWFYAEYYDPNINITEIQKKAETVDGLKELLEHNNSHIQRAAAYDLASLGDKSGVYLIEKDLQANDSPTRLHARQTLVKLQSE